MRANTIIELLKEWKKQDSIELFRDDEYDMIIEFIKSLEKENKARREMWEELETYDAVWELIDTDFMYCEEAPRKLISKLVEELEKKYLGEVNNNG